MSFAFGVINGGEIVKLLGSGGKLSGKRRG